MKRSSHRRYFAKGEGACHRGLAATHRRAAVVVCAMVVLLIAGLISMQTMQALMIIRRGDSQRSSLRQARELVELGRMRLARMGSELDEFEFTLEVEPELEGQITITKIARAGDGGSPSDATIRIVARYPVDTAREVTASWEGRQ